MCARIGVAAPAKLHDPNHYVKVFKMFDDDNTGTISTRNLGRVAKQLGEIAQQTWTLLLFTSNVVLVVSIAKLFWNANKLYVFVYAPANK